MNNINSYYKKDNETFIDYADRIIGNRSEYDLDYAEVYEMLFDRQLASDNARKSIYGVIDVIRKLKDEGVSTITADEVIDRYEQSRIEYEKEKIKAQDQKREYRKLIREMARVDYIKEYIEQSAKEIAQMKPMVFRGSGEPKFLDGDEYNEAVMLLGDFHFGMEVENYWNEYNKDIFIKRFQKYISDSIEHAKRHNVEVMHVCDLSDNISGNIHSTVRVMNNEDVITQIQFVSEMIAEALFELSTEFDFVHYHHVIDNHSRVTPNFRDSIDKESFARITPWYLKERMKDCGNVVVHENTFDPGIADFNVCGHLCYAVHGNNDNLNNVVQNLSLMTREIPDYCFIGHFHRSIEENVHGVYVIGNASGIGVDEYAKNKRLTGKAEQKLLIFNEKDGRYATYNIKLQ